MIRRGGHSPWAELGGMVPKPREMEGAALDAWRSLFGMEALLPFSPAFLQGEADAVARGLLGSILRSTVGGVEVAGVVVETEAYLGPQDPASHAAERIGRTRRNATMFGPAGRAYVYRSHGIHWCLNLVTGPVGFAAAVLIRGLSPFSGVEVASARRGGREPLGAGPGRLSQALGVGGELDGHDLSSPPLRLLQGWRIPDGEVAVSGRIGIRRAADWPLRFYLPGHPQVSRGPKGRPFGPS